MPVLCRPVDVRWHLGHRGEPESKTCTPSGKCTRSPSIAHKLVSCLAQGGSLVVAVPSCDHAICRWHRPVRINRGSKCQIKGAERPVPAEIILIGYRGNVCCCKCRSLSGTLHLASIGAIAIPDLLPSLSRLACTSDRRCRAARGSCDVDVLWVAVRRILARFGRSVLCCLPMGP